MKAWTAEERLRLLAVLLARKRQESMGRATETPINHESLLLIAVAPADVLNYGKEHGPSGPSIEDSLNAMMADLAAAPSNDELFQGVVTDIRAMFRREHWPWWAKEGT